MKFTDIQIGQGYLLIKTDKKVGVKDFAHEVSLRAILDLEHEDISEDYNNQKELREKINQDSLTDIYIKTPMRNQAFIFPGVSREPTEGNPSKEHTLGNHKIYLVDKWGNNQFYNLNWGVSDNPSRDELPTWLKMLYDSMERIISK